MREKEFLPLVKEALGIGELNEMQKRSMAWGASAGSLVISAPTGSGKTLAFLLPALKQMKPAAGRIQALILAPTRELVQQVTDVVRKIAKNYKVTALYGGHKFIDEENSLRNVPDIVVATPGRLVDHIRRLTIDIRTARILALDEFDKILELGFETEMKKIAGKLPNVSRIILTSATPMDSLPEWLHAGNPEHIDCLPEVRSLKNRLRIHRVPSDLKDKIAVLGALLEDIMPSGKEKTIVFVNHRESAERVVDALKKRGYVPGIYHGALDQPQRENAVALFNNGSTPLLVATDLAARGLDISDVRNIVHYHQPLTGEAYTHRNGRTARVDRTGDVYVIIGPEEDVRPWVEFDDDFYPSHKAEGKIPMPEFATLSISGGKKDKVSRGDIVGFLVNKGGLEADEIGKIDVKDHYSLVAVPRNKIKALIQAIRDEKLKGRKYKFYPM